MLFFLRGKGCHFFIGCVSVCVGEGNAVNLTIGEYDKMII